MQSGWFQLDTGWACGGVLLENGVAVKGAPIFKKLIGSKVSRWPARYRLTALPEERRFVSMGRMA